MLLKLLKQFYHQSHTLETYKATFAAANGAILPNLTDIQTLAPKALGGKGALGTAYEINSG